jgi:hypothetical protein
MVVRPRLGTPVGHVGPTPVRARTHKPAEGGAVAGYGWKEPPVQNRPLVLLQVRIKRRLGRTAPRVVKMRDAAETFA